MQLSALGSGPVGSSGRLWTLLVMLSFCLAIAGCAKEDAVSSSDNSSSSDDEDDEGDDESDDEGDDEEPADDDEEEPADDDDEDDTPPKSTKDAGKDAGKEASKDAGPSSAVPKLDAGTTLPTGDGGATGLPGIPGFPGLGGAQTPAKPLDPSVKTPDPSKLPKVNGTCPALKNGTFNINGTSGRMWVGSSPGPMVFYWHGTGSSSSEVDTGLPGVTAEIQRSGGIVASFETTNGMKDNTGNLVWYTGDFDAADQILACGIEKGIVDPARIYSSGYSAGGLQTGAMLFSRSNYIAAVVIYSGGPALGGLVPGSLNFADPSNIPASLGAHGAQGSDWLALDFHDGTILAGETVKKAGGFAIDCDDGGGHIDFITGFSRAGVGGKAWQFLKDHPYNTKPSPYAGGLVGFPKYCKIL